MVNYEYKELIQIDFAKEPFKSIIQYVKTPLDLMLLQSLVDFGQSERYQKDGVIHLTQMDIHEHLTDYLGGRPPDFFEQTSFCGRIMALNEQIMSKTNKPPFYKLEVYFDR